ncbi:cysteine proteinase inhibitor A-like [Cucurbita pepo subsp. pepo]|uniref:cysteine proteinase inhibitor A-like n=1 Tax=Cucurbita pepo subsp. pepo TaxID=3664 RepID=UPI000C9D4536|nr:cysteine proteinase inhibitor A-like [Cucurbita pepo subsp. pepo]XP_023536178.1 cysteine proteinase inhibitor A-like [Cucurbita pepo subsp. pepo]
MSSYVEAAPGQNEAVFQDQKGVECGQWEPIVNIMDPYVQELGRFAVMENNKNTMGHLKFICVIKGWTQVVAGKNYRLIIEACNGLGFPGTYEAIVYVKPWEKTWELIEFIPLLRN